VAEAWRATPEQEAAIGVDGSALVRAGAGSGKTAVLARRFVHLLRPGPDGAPGAVAEVGAILAVTFTEKAAAEMKRKIRTVVADEVAAAPPPLRPHWTRVARDLVGAQISTIHAFCARVLRENPLEAGVDPQAVLLDEHESRTYVEAAIEATLLARLRAGDPAARELLLRSIGLAGGRTGGAVGLCADFVARLARNGRDAAWIVAATGRQAGRAADAAAEVRRAVDALVVTIEGRLARGVGGRGADVLRAEWPAWRERLEAFCPASPLDDCLALRDLARLLARARFASMVDEFLAVLPDGSLRGAIPEAWAVVRALPENTRLAALVSDLVGDLRARKRRDGVLTFDDLVTEAHALVARHAAVRARYARRFRAILVDELQDIDRVQAELIRLLGDAPPPALLFVVGDEKQSIYRFRGADVSVFGELRTHIATELPLGTNFRSRPAILAFVNALAARIFDAPADPAPHWTRFDASQRLVSHRAAGDGVAVRLVTFVEEHARRTFPVAEARELEARVLAGVVDRLHTEEGFPYGAIAVLFRALTEVKTYENALRRREIPYYVVKGRGFFQCQEVSDVVSALAAVLDPTDATALAAALRSPLFGLDDDTLWRLAWPAERAQPALARRFAREATFADLPAEAASLERARDVLLALRGLASRATIAELIEALCAATDFEAVCLTQFQGAQKVANVRKLIALAREWERKRFFSLRDFVRTIRRLAETEPREPEAALAAEGDDVVRLMTIHQAKGLEFPVVVVPDLGRIPRLDHRVPALDDEEGVVGGPLDAMGRVLVRHAGLEAHRAREVDRERAEQARLFYVACTRAEEVLVLLEGKGDRRWLERGAGDPSVWCHQVWDVVGREQIAEFVRSDAGEATLALPAGGSLRIERAGQYLARQAPESTPAEPRVGAAGDAERVRVARVLEFSPPAPPALVTSPTALADFRRCPRQYWYRHVIGLRERGGGGVRATLLGTAAHGVLEALPVSATADEVRRLVDGRLEMLALSPRERESLTADLVAAAAALASECATGLEIVAREVPFVLGLPRGEPQIFLHGRIDVVARRAGRVVVRDYKYARPAGGAIVAHAPQLGAYRLAVGASAGSPVDGEIVFLRGGPAIRPLPPFDAEAEAGALLDAGDGLARATALGTIDAFPRLPESPDACTALGCGYVRRCWGLTGRAPAPPCDRAAS
jgi:ATP-dependent helicase/nuclease subunit A